MRRHRVVQGRWPVVDKSVLAEGEGFEPPVPHGTLDFKSSALNQALPPLRQR